ncbi:CHAT domain-containing protein, partial [Bacteroidota bacterium]
DDESKLYLSENERDTYEKGVKTAFRCYELTPDPEYLKQAFLIAEKAKYATLRSVLHREEALNLSDIPDSLWVLESSVKKQLSVYQELLMESLQDTLPDQVKIQQYRKDVFRLKDRIAALHRSLESNYPDYYELLYKQEIVDPDVLARNLSRNEKVIEYFFSGEELFIFEISRDLFSCRKDSIDGLFLQDLNLVDRYIAGNSVRDTIRDDHSSFIESASRLHSRLIPPSGESGNLIIIPEGKLSYLPFDILITAPLPEFSGLFSQVPFLIQSHTIRYGYSATLLNKQKRRNSGKLNRLIAFAPGYIKNPDELAEMDALREVRIDRSLLEALPGSIEEVAEIGKLLGGEVYTGTSASEKRFKELAGQSHIIHLATHAFLDDEDPLKSKLVFSEDPGEVEDGMLNVYELYKMDLKAGLVVLSACNTGTGQMKNGEGIMSLARAFYYAGVQNIVMTLWTVSDQQSHKLMLGFYEHLSTGRNAEISLRHAKMEYLESALPEFQHPRYWAGYILIGDPDNLFFPYRYRQLLPAIGIFIVILTGIILGRKRKNQRASAKFS